MSKPVMIRGEGVVYPQEHCNIEVPADLMRRIVVNTAQVFLTPRGHDGCREPLTVSQLRPEGFTVYNHNHIGVPFNWLVVADETNNV